MVEQNGKNTFHIITLIIISLLFFFYLLYTIKLPGAAEGMFILPLLVFLMILFELLPIFLRKTNSILRGGAYLVLLSILIELVILLYYYENTPYMLKLLFGIFFSVGILLQIIGLILKSD